MRLSPDEYKLFYMLYPKLLLFINNKIKILSKTFSSNEYFDIPLDEKKKLRDALYGNLELIDSFVKENIYDFSAFELDIISSWKHLILGRFYVLRNLKKYSIFLSYEQPLKAYGVFSITNTVDEMLGRPLPILVEAALLPFNGKIITDGFIASYGFYFGRNIRQGLNDSYEQAKARYGIITRLPFSEQADIKTKEEKDVDLLRFYLKSKQNREIYRDKISDLIYKDSKLMIVYQQEMGRIDANYYKRRLRDSGFKDAWFAVLEGNIVASGKEKKDMLATLREILPPNKGEYVYYFQLRD
ncbi:MAG: hypothetical protein AB9903_36070 [Vulcanimicrobiota bacterium]